MGVRLVKYNLGNLVGSGGTYDHNDLLNRDYIQFIEKVILT